MNITITQQGGREDAQKVFERVLSNLDDVAENWYGNFTVSFESIFESSHRISQKETDANR